MSRAFVGSLAGLLAGSAIALAQPMPPMPSPYPNYAVRGHYPERTGYDDGRRMAWGNAPVYGPIYPRGGYYAPPMVSAQAGMPTYGPVYPASNPPHSAPAGFTTNNPLPNGSGPSQTTPPSGGVGPMNEATPLPEPRPIPDGRVYPGRDSRVPMGYEGQPNMPNNGGYGPMQQPYGPWNNGQNQWGGGWGDGCVNEWGGCYDSCGGCWNCYCGPDGKVWGGAELLLGWVKGQMLPPLVTRGNDPVGNPGVIGLPGTQIIYGNARVGTGMRVGVRTRVGAWIDDCQRCGIEGSFLYLARNSETFHTECQVGDIISRPFFNTDPAVNAQDAELVCVPGVLCGDVSVYSATEFFGGDANFRRNLCCDCASRIDLVVGFRYLHLGDELSIRENLTNLDANSGVVGEGFLIEDRFETNNNFYGAQIGMAGEYRTGPYFLDWRSLIGLGVVARVVTINGQTTFLDPTVPGGDPVTQTGGLLAQRSNIGRYESSDFSIAPEVNVNVGYQFSPMLRAWVGYWFMYWTNVARAGEQIDLNVDARQLPTRLGGPGPLGINPAFNLRTNDFWAQGISFGVQIRY